jgi:hypothetical protein
MIATNEIRLADGTKLNRLVNVGCAHAQRRRTGPVTAAIEFGRGGKHLRAPDQGHPLVRFLFTETCTRCDALLDYKEGVQ